MEIQSTQIVSMAVALFLLMDPIGNIPIFISLLKDISPKRQRFIILRELVIALFIIIFFEFLGEGLLSALNVTHPTILISGGVILFLIALKMIFPTKQEHDIDLYKGKEPLIVPLAIPLVAGPAVLAAVMLYAGQAANYFATTTAVVLAWIASTLVLLSASFLKKLLGWRGIIALEKLMGLVLTLIAIEMFLDGIKLFSDTCLKISG